MVDTIFETLLHRKFASIYSSLMMLRATMSERDIPVNENDDRGTFSMHALKRPQQFPNILKNLDSIAKMRYDSINASAIRFSLFTQPEGCKNFTSSC